ncbi:MAG: hypothetical protein Q9201_005847 [Fulgogasparrea decipioides]
MNLGEANLRTVSTSKPALVHTSSKQSIAASDDYYSLSSGASSQDEKSAAGQYQTPPLHIIPEPYRRGDDPAPSKPTVRAVTPTLPLAPSPAHLPASAQAHKIKRKPVSTESHPSSDRPSNNEPISPPTPGVDDTPYIQFAIDQLTRDQEVNEASKPRLHGLPSHESYPVDRIVPDERLRLQQGLQSAARKQPSLRSIRRLSDTSATAIPATPTQDFIRFPRLDYLPKCLRLPSLVALLIYCLLMVAGIIFSNVWSSRYHGLWQYDGVGSSRYFVFQYLPQFLAIIIVLWLFIIQNALYRILPFVMMHSERRTFTSHILHTAALFPSYLIPNVWCFRHEEMSFGFCLNIFWLCLFTVPLQGCLYQTRYFTVEGESIWRWTSVQPVGWTLLVLYLLLALALVLLIWKLQCSPTGLRWDPRSLADIVVLFQRSNVLSEFYGSEARRDDHGTALLKKYTLRYWIAGKRSSEIFHGIEEAQAALHGFRLHQRSNEKHSYQLDLESQRPLKASTLDSLQKDVHSPLVRYRWLPWFLKDTFVVAWIVIAIVLMLAFIIVSFVNSAVVRGFMPMLPSPTTSQGFSPSDFLYSFVPSIIGMLLFLLWQPIDLYFRALEPFAQLGGSTRGSPADESLLLDYTACLPAEVTIKAALAGHYKVAWISFISLMSATLPILSGGIFTAQYFIPSREVRVAADMSGYYALVVFVAIYALSFLVVWPGKNRRLPHDIRSLGQILSFMYESRLLNDATFWQPRSKVDLVTRLLGTLTGDRGSSKYAFGVYRGRDGKEHLGIDRLHRPESGEMFIATAMMK